MAEAATNKGLKIYSPKRTEQEFQLLSKSSGYTLINEHLACMTGQHVQIAEKVYGSEPMPDMGQVCLRLLGVSADVQRNPALRAEDPRRDLLSPLRSILEKKGVVPSDANALYLAQQISKLVSEKPSIANSTHTFEFELFENQTEPFRLFPGMVHHAEFVKGFFDKVKDGITPLDPGFPPALVVSNTRECHDGDGLVSNGKCQLTARANLRNYFDDRQVASLAR